MKTIPELQAEIERVSAGDNDPETIRKLKLELKIRLREKEFLDNQDADKFKLK